MVVYVSSITLSARASYCRTVAAKLYLVQATGLIFARDTSMYGGGSGRPSFISDKHKLPTFAFIIRLSWQRPQMSPPANAVPLNMHIVGMGNSSKRAMILQNSEIESRMFLESSAQYGRSKPVLKWRGPVPRVTITPGP